MFFRLLKDLLSHERDCRYCGASERVFILDMLKNRFCDRLCAQWYFQEQWEIGN